MSQTFKFNPLSQTFDIVQDTTLLTLKGVVDTINDLPLSGNSENDLYIVKADDRLYTWNKSDPNGILSDWLDVGTVSSIDWSIINNKPTATVGDIDDAVSKKHIQNTDTILTTDGATALLNAGILKTNLLSDDAINIQIDEIRARDIDGLKLYDDGGNGIFVEDGGNVGIGTNNPSVELDVSGDVKISDDLIVATSLIFTDKSNGSVTIGNSVTGTDRFNVFGAGFANLQTGIAAFYNSAGSLKFRLRDEWTASSIPPRIEADSSLGLAFNTTTNSQYIWYINGTGNEKMRLNSTGLGIGTISPDALLDVEKSVAGSSVIARIHHAEGTNGSSHAILQLQTETAFGGDPHIRFTVGGQGDWVMGTDNGDTDAFKISKSTILATNTRLKINYLGSIECLSTEGAFSPNIVTTTERDAFIFTNNGMIIYNSTLNKFQGRENGAWANLI